MGIQTRRSVGGYGLHTWWRMALVLGLLVLISQPAWAQFSGAGSGTLNDPYQITTVAQLDEVRNNLLAHYILMNNLDLAGTPQNDNSGAGWEPIGTFATPFQGTFDGQYHTISNLVINRPTTNRIGFFSRISDLTSDGTPRGIIENLGIVNAQVVGQRDVGILAGLNDQPILNSYTSGQVSGTEQVGGLVGSGGFAYRCYSTAAVTATVRRGGGLIGQGNSIFDSYSTGAVQGGQQIGGLVGDLSSTLHRSYSTGRVTGSTQVGGLVGQDLFRISGDGSFWDTETSRQATSSGQEVGKTTAELKTLATFTDVATNGLSNAWDFAGTPNDDTRAGEVWSIDPSGIINDGYPYLIWQTAPPTLPPGNGTAVDPYRITTVAHLHAMRHDLYGHYILMNNLDLAGAPENNNNGAGWDPVGWEAGFRGTFDGNQKTIHNLFINRPTATNVGLFGSTHGSAGIHDIGIVSANVVGSRSIGILIGRTSDPVTRSYSTGQVRAQDASVGGLIGTADAGAIVTDSYSTASVTGVFNVGGLIGTSTATVNTSYSTGSVSGTSLVGGLLGNNVTFNGGTTTNSFWDTQTSGQATSPGPETGKTTAELKALATFTSTATLGLDTAWDFVGTANDDAGTADTWTIDPSGTVNGGYPYHVGPPVPFELTLPSPVHGAPSVPRTSNVSATFTAPVNATTATANTFVLYGNQSGRRTGTVTASGNQVTFDPAFDFFPGEIVSVVATAGLTSTASIALAPSYAWHFHAATAPSSGIFSIENIISDAASSVAAAHAADFDGDRDIDLVAALESTGPENTGRLVWYRNDGTGAFAQQPDIASGIASPRNVHAADLDGDGDPDVLSTAISGNTIVWHRNNGDGTFTTQPAISTKTNVNAIYPADLDGDGDQDVIGFFVFSSAGGSIFWYQNDGTGTFTEQPAISTEINRPDQISVADLDNDHDLDLITNFVATGHLVWYQNNGSGTFAPQPSLSTQAQILRALETGDVDADGDIDVLTSVDDTGLIWYQNNGTGTFGAQPPISTTNSGDATLVDVDGDGHLDVIANLVDSVFPDLTWFKNDGTGTFTRQSDFPQQNPSGLELHTGDMDGDGDVDVITLNASDDEIAWHKQMVVTRTISGDAGWRMLSAPITGFTASQLADDTAIQGIPGSAFPDASPNLYTFPSTGTWTAPTDMTTPWGDGVGFIAYFFDNNDFGSTPLPVTLDAVGSPFNTSASITLNTGGFTLAGNPYHVPFALDRMLGTGSLVSPIHVWNDGTGTPGSGDASTTTGSFETFNFGSGQGHVIAPWQGFMLESSTATQVHISPSARTANAPTVDIFGKQATHTPPDRTLALHLEGPQHTLDRSAKLYFHPEARAGVDGFDGSKLMPLLSEYATLAFVQHVEDGTERLLVQDGRARDPVDTQTYDLAFTSAGLSGTFTLRWPEWTRIPGDWQLHLHDSVTGTTVDLRTTDHYSFEAGSTAQPEPAAKRGGAPPLRVASVHAATVRFRLTLQPSPTATGTESAGEQPIAFALHPNYPNPFNPTTRLSYDVAEASAVHLVVYDALGREVTRLVDQHQPVGRYRVTWDAGRLPSGLYVARFTVRGRSYHQSMVLLK